MPGTSRQRLSALALPLGRRVVLAVVIALLLMIALQDFRFRRHQWEGPFLTALTEAAVEGGVACLSEVTRFAWDRVYLLPPAGDIGAHPAVAELSWSDGDSRALDGLRAAEPGVVVVVFALGRRVQWYGALPRHGVTPDGERVEVRLASLPLAGLVPEKAAFSAELGLGGAGMYLLAQLSSRAPPCRNRATVW